MKTLIDGTQQWTTEEIVRSNLGNDEKFSIKVGELRLINKLYEDALKKIEYLKMENDIMKMNIREHSRFVVSA